LKCGKQLPLPPDPIASTAYSFTLKTYGFYEGIISNAGPVSGRSQEPCLGGKLLYAGELDGQGRALTVAGNVAGAATLSTALDPIAQKQAVRDGVVDFLVTSLDEALRILKNEIRKREAVAVCAGGAPADVEREMLERGVLPDLLRSCPASEHEQFRRQGALFVEPDRMDDQAVISWKVNAASAQWLPRLDAIAFDCLESNDWSSRRWLRLAPRYLGRLASRLRMIHCERDFAARFIEQIRKRVQLGEIGVSVEVRLIQNGRCEEYRIGSADENS
jgi:hypothetical protein